jgi:hypothetical protein
LTHARPAQNRKNGGALKRKNLICRTSEGQTRGLILPGVQNESGRCISLWVLASRSANCLRVNFLRKKRAFFGQLRESVVGDSLKFFERGFLQRAVQLFKR